MTLEQHVAVRLMLQRLRRACLSGSVLSMDLLTRARAYESAMAALGKWKHEPRRLEIYDPCIAHVMEARHG